MHITGQVNQRESSAVHGANVRQSGFQETKIVEMVKPITKYAVLVHSVEELRDELAKAYQIAITGRMGPVLIDVPMDIQQADIEPIFPDLAAEASFGERDISDAITSLEKTLAKAKRPIVLWGGGIALAGVERSVLDWLQKTNLPFVSSWAGLSSFDHATPGFLGQIGVYGNRGANFALQNADAVIVLGSRLDNRQRSGNVSNFAAGAVVHVVDIDPAEIAKYGDDKRYRGTHLDLSALPKVLDALQPVAIGSVWLTYIEEMKSTYFGRETSTTAVRLNSLSPYDVVRRLAEIVDEDAIIAADTGAAVCWLHQAFQVKKHQLFTSGGNSPMGFALCAAIGAKLEAPEKQVISYNGDGGFQVNIQEMQTLKHLNLDVAVIVMNNGCYGIIKQFQDSYLGSRYTASLDGYSTPDFGQIAKAYGIDYARVEHIEDLKPELFKRGAILIDVILSDQTQIEPKLEMGRPINDQYPYLGSDEYARGNRFVDYPRPEAMKLRINASHQ